MANDLQLVRPLSNPVTIVEDLGVHAGLVLVGAAVSPRNEPEHLELA